MAWTTRSTRTTYENRWISVREDEVTGPAGDGIYGVVEMRHPAVFVVAVDEQDRVCFVEVDRYTTGRSLEVPAGGTDGEEPLVAAKRELLEETGLVAASWEAIGRMNALNGIAVAPEHVFLARGLAEAEDAASSQREEGIERVVWIPFAEAVRQVAERRIDDGETVAALAYAGISLGRFV
ncbi:MULTISPECIES: NUDIX domain-containing protein [Microbacterium]|uniref:NUDIX domain-containing protein n=1 Tax=Microbacterium plantarum TaxID=1816425 RepID=A0ABV5ERI4_9MICO|nr:MULTISPECIES: NUDIX hydrolase [Microbacterium]RAZ34406.1 NUDIX hydrolase [Microbacterium sp. SMR1]